MRPLRPSLTSFAIAVLACLPGTLACTQARSAPQTILLLFLAGNLVAARWGGTVPGLIVALVGLVGMAYVDSLPAHIDSVRHSALGIPLSLYVAVAAAISVAGGSLRRNEHRVRRQAGLARAMSSSLREGVVTVDNLGRVTSLNPSAAAMLGCTEQEILGWDIREVIHVQTNHIEDAIREGKHVAIHRDVFLRGDGPGLSVAYAVNPIRNGKDVTGAAITFEDAAHQLETESHRMGERYYRSLVEIFPDSMLVADLYGYITMVNHRAAELFGYGSPHEMFGKRLVELFAPESRGPVIDDKKRTLENGTVRNTEHQAVRHDGSVFPVETSTSAIVDDDDILIAQVTVLRDMTQHRRTEDVLRASTHRLPVRHAVADVLARSSTLGAAVPDLLEAIAQDGGWDLGLFWSTGQEEDVLRCRAAWMLPASGLHEFQAVSQQMPCGPDIDLPGRVWSGGKTAWVSEVARDADFRRALVASQCGLQTALCFAIRSGATVHGVMEFFSREVRQPDDELLQTSASISTSIGQFMKRKQAEKAMEYKALHDSLTDLPNRALFQERLERALSVAITGHHEVAVLLIDLDRFKQVNDTFGHRLGDLLLQQAGLRLESILRDSDTVARMGGDEFSVVLPATDTAGGALVAGKILTCLQEPFVIEGQRLEIGASIGIAAFPEHADDAATLMERADSAMYAAKRTRTGYAIYEPDDGFTALSRLG